MTEDQKTGIRNLRERGMSYKEIAESLCLTKAQVAGFCRRNSIAEGSHKSEPPLSAPSRCKTAAHQSHRSPVRNSSFSAPTTAVKAGGTATRRLSGADSRLSIISPALIAASHSQPTGTATGNTAPMPAILQSASKAVTAMNDEQFEREKLYQASMEMFKLMMDNGIISKEQFEIIRDKMNEKYKPLFGTLSSL